MRTALLLTASLCLAAGCSSETEAPPPVAPPPVQPVAVEPTDALRPTPDGTWGIPVPAGVTVDDRSNGAVHYRIRADWADLDAFYARHIADWEREDYERGARFVAPDGSGRAVYLYRDAARRSWVLSYFEAGTHLDATHPLSTQTPSLGSGAAAGAAPSVGGAGSATGASATDSASAQGADTPGGFASSTSRAATGSGTGGAPSTSSGNAGANTTTGLAARTYRSRLDDRIGARTPGSSANGPSPVVRPGMGPARVHPRLRDYAQEQQRQRPVRFIRGVPEQRRNPNAMF
jgi:hypothetical protein